MKHISLFSGMGGFDLAAEWMGWENVAHCEWNKFCQQILRYYWPNAKTHDDITKTDFSIYRGNIDILTGGFPCQPYSVAGKQDGKDDERHLWPHMLRAVREIKPRWVVGENVLGLVSWNDGLVFNEVQSDLEAEGYEVQPFVLPAAGVGAPHQRQRVWFVGYAEHHGVHATESRGTDHQPSFEAWAHQKRQFEGTDSLQSIDDTHTTNSGFKGLRKQKIEADEPRNVTHSQSERSRGLSLGEKSKKSIYEKPCGSGDASNTKCFGGRQDNRQGKSRQHYQTGEGNYWKNFPTQSPICNGNDGVSPKLDGITFSKWRNESIKAGGNAIVPQVALKIFKAIQAYEKLKL
ncbi:Modification methylase HhaI [compost metagenome]